MSALWTASDFVASTGGRAIGRVPDVKGISIDSRTLDPGDAFFAIRGDRFDGHDFVAAAIERGAAVAVVDEVHAAALKTAGAALVVVPDVLEALRLLGIASRARSAARIIGVTGSVGKTATKEALRLALSRSGRTHASAASYNNHWGVPLSLARMPAATRFGVFEMGMNAPGEISVLTRLVRPEIAIVTTVEPVHLEFFGTVEKIADAKAEIFEGLEPGGSAVLNLDNPQFGRLADAARAHGARIVTFGAAEEADARLVRVALHPDCSCVTARLFGREVTYKLGAPGRHLVGNSLAVLAAADLAGADLALAVLALADLRAPKGRGARFRLKVGDGTITVIDESYNANPASMRAALALLGQAQPGPRGRRIAVIGDMRELGAAADDLHRDLAEPLTAARVDLLLGAGPHTRALYEAVDHRHRHAWTHESEALRDELLGLVRPGDVVMVKGSLGSRMGPLVEALRERFARVEGGAA